MHALKYENIRVVAAWMGRCMAAAWQLHGRMVPECLVPIPLHKSRMREREYNQAALLARAVGHELRIPVREELLFRSRNTRSQTHLSLHDRRENVRSCFSAVSGRMPSSILLVDDVFTTGATLTEATQALKKEGAQSISALVFAHG